MIKKRHTKKKKINKIDFYNNFIKLKETKKHIIYAKIKTFTENRR